MYINVWYVAGFSKDLTNEPIKVTMLGADLVLFREMDGTPRCISNVCPHRGSSLADGILYKDGTLSCPFHGYRFNGHGKCTLVPSRRDHEVQVVAPGMRTDAYATIEKYGLIWVCLGDDPDAASPIFDMPEWDDDQWCYTTNEEIWEADYHTCKFTNLDYVHLPVVHGIMFQGNENPVQAPEHKITATEHGYQSVMRVNSSPSAGVWKEMREEGAKVESIMKYFVPGFTLRGQVEIGGIGSGEFNIFYEFTTPIDESRTMMRHIFLRNYRMEEDFNTEHTRRNLQNIHQDKVLAESQRPLVAPTGPNPNGIYTHDEDGIMLTYWGLMENLRNKGWQIDRSKLQAPDKAVRIIPSPSRKEHKDGWVYKTMPLIAPEDITAPSVKDLKFVDIDSIEPTRPKDYGKSEPVIPRDAKSNATLEWEDAALALVEKAPGFVQPMIIKNAEKAAKADGSNFVSVKLMEELQEKHGGGAAASSDGSEPKPKMAKRKLSKHEKEGLGMENGKELDGKVVIVTGGTMGIGFGMATRLAKYGAKVVITSRNNDTGEAALGRLREAAGCVADDVAYFKMDIISETDNEDLVNFTVEKFGRLDSIINNAVFPGDFQLLADESLESFQQVINTNVTGTYLGMKFAIKQFLAQGAETGDNYSIINISSGATRDTGMRMAPYIASKLAVEGLTQAAALEYSRQGIRINTLLFGMFETEKALEMMKAMPMIEEKGAAKHHVGRFGDPEHDAGEAATYLISERSSFITGTTVHVDGGMCL
ncbi:MAG: SDR family oxidoreductase [Gammaproteobacteria bacterium]|nr:SDR family oxidoreductase [Gammaproteobacteria bacterium]MCP4088320.1 SDR family oxidoreductase [Gammaproteobacteria bacterium]MCP4276369.1 SDR family oxidoreductase [Gammaproteobacteria bacterium]MCP4831016.1 SDR family oxidoreductase [Gammaproteobacteria bacterium]